MSKFSKLILFTFLISLTNTLSAKNYYVSISGSDSNLGTSTQSPWKTLTKLNSVDFEAGDIIHFNRGDMWTGRFQVMESGTAEQPIKFTSYGKGALPKLSNPEWDYDWDGVVMRVSGRYIIIEQLHFLNGPVHPYESKKYKHENVYDMGAVNLTIDSKHCTVQFCEFEDYPIGVQSQGVYNKIFQNYFHDSNKGMCLPWWGPIGVFCGGPHNEISYNYIINYRGDGSKGFDGGAIEIDRFMWGEGRIGYGADYIKVHHNISIENAGFLEPEAMGSSIGNNFLEIYSNYSDDFNWFISDEDLNYSTIRNNTSLRVLPWKRPVEHVIIINGEGDKVLNNVFITANKLEVFHTELLMERKNNLYYSHDNSTSDPVGRLMDTSEEVLTSWKKLSPELYNSDGELLRPKPDNEGVIKAWVPTDVKYEFESFSITLPQYVKPESVDKLEIK